jgi:outer membrane protein assembly factor BamB
MYLARDFAPDALPSLEIRTIVRRFLERSPVANQAWSPAPPVQIFPIGRTPVYKPPSLKHFFQYGGFALSTLLTTLFTFAIGASMDNMQAVMIPGGAAVAQDAATGELISNLDKTLVRVDFEGQEVHSIAELPFAPSELAAAEGAIYALDPAAGMLTAVDVRSGKTRWTVKKATGYRGLEVGGEYAYVLDPVRSRVIKLNKSNGAELASATVPGLPWDLHLSSGRLFVALPDKDQVVVLNASDLTTIQTVKTQDPVAVAVTGDRLWSLSVEGARLEAVPPYLRPRPSRLHLTEQLAVLYSNETEMVVEGHERVTIINSDGALTRVPTLSKNLIDVVITKDGQLFEVTNDGFYLLKY